MTIVQRVARISGWGFVVLAIWGGLLAGTSMVAEPALAPRLWGTFPVNFPHNLLHLAFGLWGLHAAGSTGRARIYASVGGVLYLLLAALGLFASSVFGLVPIGGNNVWLHGLIAIVLLGAAATISTPPSRPTERGPEDEPRERSGTDASPPHGTVLRSSVDPEEPPPRPANDPADSDP